MRYLSFAPSPKEERMRFAHPFFFGTRITLKFVSKFTNL